ncbi:MAG: hypothetical protein ACM3JD_09825 [Rudaea sp.]
MNRKVSSGIRDDFESGFHPDWVRFAIGHAGIEHETGVARLLVDGAVPGELSDAELDDHRTAPRWKLKWSPPLRLIVRARFSHPSGDLRGTAGFGFWNDPFDWVGNVQSPPNSIWFFYASRESDMAFVRGAPGSGWKAAFINGGRANRFVMAAANFVFRIPGMSKLVFAAAERRLDAAEAVLDIDLREWHEYQIDWGRHDASFRVDGSQILRAPNPPNVPLGFVAWVDNNATSIGAGKEFSFTRIAVPGRQWMEISLIEISLL